MRAPRRRAGARVSGGAAGRAVLAAEAGVAAGRCVLGPGNHEHSRGLCLRFPGEGAKLACR